MRLPLPMALDHVNVYALEDEDGWTIIDTGLNTPILRDLWRVLLDGPLSAKPVRRVLVTHYHPDHVGLAGWFQSELKAELWITRTSWLFARMLQLDEQVHPVSEVVEFWRRAGMPAQMIEKRRSERPFNFADAVAPLPVGFRRLIEGESIRLADRCWRIHMGHGHAPEHATLWSEDDHLIIGGDQFLPRISPNVGVYPTEPEADPLKGWLNSCRAFSGLATEDRLVLPGHNRPFYGLPFRLRQLIENHTASLDRLVEFLRAPRVVTDCFVVLFRRPISDGEYGLAMGEALANLNHLLAQGRVTRSLRENGAWVWQAV
ncbi:MBL fold metallo-hydrolase [Qingshengfaniella alkalisoli]|uniref:MBL fold metallo-hydrolase n=2 Tax=Qingshengfaniella alkalisoli TaxID=2599296 RepID=A0A5B8IVR5_9RHOB|nr:MBL fold metallo-hydrolase [Qingshengfaniella alkalisoli]